MNESDSAAVPPAEPAHPTVPQVDVATPANSSRSSAEPNRASPAATEGEGGARDHASQGDADGPAADGGGGGEEGGAEGEGGRRRRRRRRRRKGGPGGAEASTEGATDATAEGGDPAGEINANVEAGPRPPRPPRPVRPPRPQGQQQQSQRPSKQREHREHRDPRDRRGPRDSQHSAMLAVRALADMAQSLLRIEGVDPLSMPRYLELNLRVPLDGGNDIRHAAGTAVEQILQRVREVREHEQALRPGAVYSYFDDSSHAEGCRPREPRHVFDGYSSTGKPNFADFVTLAIERKDANIDGLLAGEEVVLTHVTMGRVLRTQQLAEFGSASPVFKILGQVDAGLFRVLNDAGRCAFSFQLLRGSTLEGRVRLRMHAVGAVDPMDLADPALIQILSRFQRKLDGEALRLEGQLKNGEVDEEAFVLPLLQDLARQLQSRTKNHGRRTQHGLERSEEGQRPTSRAYPDAAEASDQAILWDIDQATVCVLGPKGRVHVFTPEGKHVTSVVMQGAAIERRRHQGRWRQAEPEERGEFRIRIKSLVAAGRDVTTEAEPLPDGGAAS